MYDLSHSKFRTACIQLQQHQTSRSVQSFSSSSNSETKLDVKTPHLFKQNNGSVHLKAYFILKVKCCKVLPVRRPSLLHVTK